MSLVSGRIEDAPGTIGGPADNSGSAVSWQTIFWTLLGAAFNIALQNAGNSIDLDRKNKSSTLQVAMRSSPIVCFVDTAHCLGLIIWLICHGLPPVDAARYAWLDRFPETSPWERQLGGTPATEPTERSSAFVRDKLWGLSILAFLLGTFPQLIKLFGCENIPAAKTLAAVFLVTFVVPEVLRLIATIKRGSPLARLPTHLARQGEDGSPLRLLERYTLGAAIISQVCLWMLMISYAWVYEYMMPSFDETSSSAIVSQHEVILRIFAPLVIGSLVQFAIFWLDISTMGDFNTIWRRPDGYLGRLIHALATSVTISLFYDGPDIFDSYEIRAQLCQWVGTYLFFSQLISIAMVQLIPLISLTTTMAISPLVYAGGLILYRTAVLCRAVVLKRAAGAELSRELVGSEKDFRAGLFLTLNILTFFLYYRFLYFSEGTAKPDWADNLG